MSLLKEMERKLSFSRGRDVNQLLLTIENISHIKDLDSLMETVLLEARHFVHADAGTIYLVSDDNLYFSYVQNDTLFQGESPREKYVYSRQKMAINKDSLAGYVATTGQSLLIDDVYDIRSEVSYSFDASFDTKSDYRTRSIMVIPITTRDESILGVLQLINAKNEESEVVPFSMQDRLYITQFAQNAAHAIEKVQLSQELVLRMVHMAELRDPFETAQHARRVGAYSIEIYRKWADKHGLSLKEIKNHSDILRSAAILHDVGKVAVSDMILKKEGELSYDERLQLRYHTVYGARLFRYTNSPWDKLAAEVALNHHERWDGKGYPGYVDDIYASKVYFGKGKKDKKIPISARIVAVADVYDALVSKRVYKPAWRDDHAIKHIRLQAGKHFDPEIVQIVLSMEDVMLEIRKRFPEAIIL